MNGRQSAKVVPSDCSTVDPELLENTCSFRIWRKSRIAIQNDTDRVLYAVVADDRNVQIVTKLNTGIKITTNALGGHVDAVWNFARANVERRTIPRGKKAVFEINGGCGHMWISDKIDFPKSSTPYSSMRVPKGHVHAINENVFTSLPIETSTPTAPTPKQFEDFLAKQLDRCHLLDVPGIGAVNAQKLQAVECSSAKELMRRFDVNCHGSTSEMIAWLKSACGIQQQYAEVAAHALQAKRHQRPADSEEPAAIEA